MSAFSVQNLLLRSSLLGNASPSALQSRVDGLVGGFIQQATDWRSLAAMTAGGLAYRTGRMGILGLGSGTGLSALSAGVGLAAEVSIFEFTHRGLSSVTVGAHGRAPLHANLWSWNGPGGLRQGLLQSFVAFGALKGAGRLSRGENFITQHLFQDTAMVLGHQTTGTLGLGPRPTGNLAEQFLHAEATNLQLGAGMALGHGLVPGLHGLERGLNLALPHSPPGGIGSYFSLGERAGARLELALAAVGPRRPSESPHVLAMGILDWGKEKLRRFLGGDQDGTEDSPSPQPTSPRPASPQTGPYRGTLPTDPLLPYLDFFRNQGAYDWQLAALEQSFRSALSRKNSRRLSVIQTLSRPETLQQIRSAVGLTGIVEPRIKALLETAVIQRLAADYFSPSELPEELEAALSSLQPDPEISNFILPVRTIARTYLEMSRLSLWLPLGHSPGSRHLQDLYQGLLIYEGLLKDMSPEYYERMAEGIRKNEATSSYHGFNTPLGLFHIWFDIRIPPPIHSPKGHFIGDVAQSVRFLLESGSPEVRRTALQIYEGFLNDLAPVGPRDYSKLEEALNPILGPQDPELYQEALKILAHLRNLKP